MAHASLEARRAYARGWYRKNAEKLLPVRNARERLARLLDPNRARKYNIKKKYGLTLAQYDRAVLKQGGVCAICKRPPKRRRLNIDHDHKTGRIRGLLCWWCNSHVVTKNVNSEHLRRAADYIDSTNDLRDI